jgi:site-specific DNA recombinase
MTTPTTAAIYARISLDQEGLGKGVDRQVADCKLLAKQLGWTVTDHYVDNDVSAYSGKHRPQYERMLADIEDGTVDAVLVYNLDRLTRQPKEFERFNDIAAAAGMADVRFVTGDMDFGTDDGLFIGRIQAAVAAKESATKSRRIKRKNEERAAEGKPHGGSTRPFGFEDDRVTHNKAEAKIVRQLAARYLAGESLHSLASWLHDQGVPTVTGAEWHTHTIRRVISAPRTAGLRDRRGEIVGPATWKPIIAPADRDRILALFETKKVSGRRAARRYLLSGQLRCGHCQNVLFSAARKTTRRYVCSSGPDHGGCGGLSVVALPVEELVAEAVLLRLDTPQLADALAGRDRTDEDTAQLIAALEGDREQLGELAGLYADKSITASEWMKARDQIETRVRKGQKRLAQSSSHTDLAAVIGQGAALRSQWSDLNLDRQAAIIKAVVDFVTILPGTRGVHALDPARVVPVWRL